MGLDPYQPAYAGFSNYVTFGFYDPQTISVTPKTNKDLIAELNNIKRRGI